MKKYFIGVLAALMLFAFTACDNSVPTVSYNDVSYVEVEQVKSFLEGDAATEDGFQIVVNYTSASPVVISGNKGNIKISGDTATATDSIKFYDMNNNLVPVVGTEIAYTPVTSVSANVSAIEIEEGSKLEDGFSIINPEVLADVSFTLVGGDIERVYTMADKAAGKFDVVLSLWNEDGMLATSTAVKEGETYTVTLDKYRFANSGEWIDVTTAGKGMDTGITVSVVEAVTPDTDIARIVVAVVKSATVEDGEEPEIISNPWIDEKTIAVIGYNAAGDFVKFVETNDYTVIGDSFPSTTLPLGTEESPAATGMVYLKADPSVNAAYSLSGRDYVKSISLEKATVSKAAGTQYTIADVGKVTATTASGASKEVTATTTPISFPANATTGSVTATVTYVNEKGDDVTAKVTINVTAATK